jgi:hypothetical protein
VGLNHQENYLYVFTRKTDQMTSIDGAYIEGRVLEGDHLHSEIIRYDNPWYIVLVAEKGLPFVVDIIDVETNKVLDRATVEWYSPITLTNRGKYFSGNIFIRLRAMRRTTISARYDIYRYTAQIQIQVLGSTILSVDGISRYGEVILGGKTIVKLPYPSQYQVSGRIITQCTTKVIAYVYSGLDDTLRRIILNVDNFSFQISGARSYFYILTSEKCIMGGEVKIVPE